jgi:hypothetical protein
MNLKISSCYSRVEQPGDGEENAVEAKSVGFAGELCLKTGNGLDGPRNPSESGSFAMKPDE